MDKEIILSILVVAVVISMCSDTIANAITRAAEIIAKAIKEKK